jgi:hypothetical protein
MNITVVFVVMNIILLLLLLLLLQLKIRDLFRSVHDVKVCKLVWLTMNYGYEIVLCGYAGLSPFFQHTNFL